MVNNYTQPDSRRGGQAAQRRADWEEVWKASKEGARDAPREAGNPTHQERGGGPP